MEQCKEIITDIDSDYGWQDDEHGYYMCYSGVKLTTTRQTIKFLISSAQDCCEEHGYLVTQDKEGDFIGAEVLKIILVDKALKTTEYPDLDSGDVIFLNIETNRGTLQLTAYNSHNGYYGHGVKVISSLKNGIHIDDSI